MKYFLGSALCALAISLTACSSADPLDNALKNYKSWKTITVTTQHRGNITNVRTDGQYRDLVQVFNANPSSNYSSLAKWVETNHKDIPAPIYWDLATMALKEHKPESEVLKWMFIGQGVGRYDIRRCRNSRSSGAYIELI